MYLHLPGSHQSTRFLESRTHSLTDTITSRASCDAKNVHVVQICMRVFIIQECLINATPRNCPIGQVMVRKRNLTFSRKFLSQNRLEMKSIKTSKGTLFYRFKNIASSDNEANITCRAENFWDVHLIFFWNACDTCYIQYEICLFKTKCCQVKLNNIHETQLQWWYWEKKLHSFNLILIECWAAL